MVQSAQPSECSVKGTVWGVGFAAVATALLGTALLTDARDLTADECWEPTFSEDFNELSLWNPEDGSGIWKTSYIWGNDIRINNELQYYVDPRQHPVNPFSINEGILKITANKTAPNHLESTNNLPYTSGVLTTEKSFAQKYGRFEARVKVPAGKGLWAAFWLLPSFDRWPEGVAVLPEIDVMEYLGHEKNRYHTTLHTNQTGKLTSHGYEQRRPENLSHDFHVYGVNWQKDRVDWTIDGELVASHDTPKDFTEPVHFLLNLAVGGTWPGAPDKRTRFPSSYEIDWVRGFKPSGSCP